MIADFLSYVKSYQKSRGITDTSQIKQMSLRQEFMWLSLILIIGLSLRLLFITLFPTKPFSDFLSLLDFAIVFRDDWVVKNAWQWYYLSPGLPLILSIVLRFVHQSPEIVGRWTTAFITGLVPVLPYLMWKDVLSPRTRIIAALFLAIWPSQILFSSVLAQDNWIIFPTVTILVLAVRVLVMNKAGGNPVLFALLYGVAGAIRQEMIFALLPATLVAIYGNVGRHRIRNLFVGIASIGIVMATLVVQRGLATGSYTLSSPHAGKAILGAYIPGAGMGWIDPIPYVKFTYPELMNDGDSDRELAKVAWGITWREFMDRPVFHAVRIFGAALTNLFEMDSQLAWLSVGEEMLPPGYQKNASRLTNHLLPLFKFYPVVINLLFTSALFFTFSHRHLLKWITPILVTIVLKVGLHAVVVSQARYYLVVIALEILVVSIVWDSMLNKENWKQSLRFVTVGIVTILLLIVFMNYAKGYIKSHDIVLYSPYKLSDYASNTVLSRSGLRE